MGKPNHQQTLPRLIREIHHESHSIHLSSASYLGLMWHEDGLMMAQLATNACLRNLRQAASVVHAEKGSIVTEDFAENDSTCSPSTNTEATGELSSTGGEGTKDNSADEDETPSHSSQMSHESNSKHAGAFADIV